MAEEAMLWKSANHGIPAEAGDPAYTCATDTKKSTSMPRRSWPCAGAGGGARFGFMPSARRSPAARAT
uniref:Uncharacterized protein n=1 Tax=Oryza barthii TaxID=65489 RepID=A0A0D3HPR5_9ORYZ